jgi:hypothetical protein
MRIIIYKIWLAHHCWFGARIDGVDIGTVFGSRALLCEVLQS